MIFSSYEFIFLFLPLTFIGFFLTSRISHSLAICWLVFCSFFFYGWWDVSYLPLIAGSMLFNYVIGRVLGRGALIPIRMRRIVLAFGIIANLSLLGVYKYTDFIIQNVNTIMRSEYGLLNLTLPLAISFFTFQQIAFLVDAYKGKTSEYSFLHYSLFVTFFPQLIAGRRDYNSFKMSRRSTGA